LNFNEQQKKAINFYKGACAVIAGAGSGKSTVLVNRIKNLVDQYDVPENEILAITFTRNTADELKSKLNKMGYKNINAGTFHSVCGKILLQEDIITGKYLIKDWQVENCLKSINEKVDVEDVKGFISYQKNYLRSYSDEFVPKSSGYTENELRQYFKAYETFKKKENVFDFDDYLIWGYDVLKNNPGKYTYDFLLVDEHQDSNLVQNLLLKELCVSGNLFCVFDYRQAIYSFRGGNTEYCMNFDKEWDNATVINLDTNYRSSNNIVNKANHFIKGYYGDYKYYADSIPDSDNDGHLDVNTYYDRETEGKEIVDEIQRLIADGEDLNEIAVLYRLNSHSSYVENELKKRDIDYEITNASSFFKRKEVAGVMAYLRLINNPHDDSAFESIFKLRNYPLTFFSGAVFNEVRKFAGLNNLSLYESFITMRYSKPWQQTNARIFEDNISRLRLQKDKGVDVITLINNIVRSFQVEEFIQNNYSNQEDIEDRINSIDVLKSFVKGDNLEKFIAYVYGNSNNNKKKSKKSCVKLMSIHASKGLEFKNVFLIGVEDGKFPHEKSDTLDEARLFYVGVTRAKDNLHISQIYDGNKFVDEYVS
jgi:DNA helicase-2/ATP-dependent DNA helicase PcrA